MQTQNAEVPEFDNPIAVEAGDKSSDLTAFQIHILAGQGDPMRSHMVDAVLSFAHPASSPLSVQLGDGSRFRG